MGCKVIEFATWRPQPTERVKSLLLQRSIAQGDQISLLRALESWSDEQHPEPDFNGKVIHGDPVLDVRNIEPSHIEEALADWSAEDHRDACLHNLGSGMLLGVTWDMNWPTPMPTWHGLFLNADAFHKELARKGFIADIGQYRIFEESHG